LLEHLGITTAPRYRIKEVPRSGQVEFKAIAEIFFRFRILCRHKGPAFRTSRSDAVADAAWQAITSWIRSNKSRLQNLVHYLLPYRKKDQFNVESFGAESPILDGKLRALLEHLGITTAPQYKIKEVLRSGQVEFKAIVEIFFRSRILCRHKGPALRTSRSDAIADAAWQAITSWIRSNMSRLQNSVHYLLPYRKKDQFKAYGVEKDIPRMEMVQHQDVAVELSTLLLTAQHKIKTLCAQQRNADATIRGYRRMVDGQASDLYASDTDTWKATSSVQSSGKEPAVSSHSTSGSRSR
jgi:hypothetical protein